MHFKVYEKKQGVLPWSVIRSFWKKTAIINRNLKLVMTNSLETSKGWALWDTMYINNYSLLVIGKIRSRGIIKKNKNSYNF